MDGVGLGEREFGDFGVESVAVASDHLIGSAHGPERRRQRAAGGVLKRLSRRECGFVPHDPGPLTSSTSLDPFVMIQWRLTSWTVSGLSFEMRTV